MCNFSICSDCHQRQKTKGQTRSRRAGAPYPPSSAYDTPQASDNLHCTRGHAMAFVTGRNMPYALDATVYCDNCYRLINVQASGAWHCSRCRCER